MKLTLRVPGSQNVVSLALIIIVGVIAVIAIAITAPTTVAATTTIGLTYYVSTSGSDTNPGTLGSPWRTIQHAANTVAAGDTVFVRAGVYSEYINIPVSGNAAAGYTTFQSYPGETAIVDGTGLAVPNGQYGLFNINNQSYLIISGFEIRNYKTTSTKYVPVGIYIYGAGSYLQILNNHIHNIETSAKGCNANALGMAVYGTRPLLPSTTSPSAATKSTT